MNHALEEIKGDASQHRILTAYFRFERGKRADAECKHTQKKYEMIRPPGDSHIGTGLVKEHRKEVTNTDVTMTSSMGSIPDFSARDLEPVQKKTHVNQFPQFRGVENSGA